MDTSQLPFPKGPRRADVKRTKQAKATAADKQARAEAWARCQGRCEDCGRRIRRGGGLLDGAEFHHVQGRRVLAYRVLCHRDHFPGPSGAHRGHR